jgi:methionine sulfoxide reductase heme-binding subunit
MVFLLVLVITIAVAFALRNPLKEMPWVFYAAATVVVVLLFLGVNDFLGPWWKPLLLLIQRCMVPLALFTLVMFIGVLPKTSKAALWLRPVRAELSIVACILCLGHVCMYLGTYATRVFSGSMRATTLISFCIALVLFILLLILGITSFNFIKRHMSTHAWKNVQRFAYVFFMLTYVHLMFILLPAALQGGEQAKLSVIIYTLLFASYGILRILRAYRDKTCES